MVMHPREEQIGNSKETENGNRKSNSSKCRFVIIANLVRLVAILGEGLYWHPTGLIVN